MNLNLTAEIQKKSPHQKEISEVLSRRPTPTPDNLRHDLPKNAIPCFSESYILKKGLVVTTGLDINITAKDADFIKSATPEALDFEIKKISKDIGYPSLEKQIKNIIDWVAKNIYEDEKDQNGRIFVRIEFSRFITGNNEIKVGKNWYKVPDELL